MRAVSWHGHRKTLHSTIHNIKIRNKYSQKGIEWPQSQFPHSCFCERLYIPTIGVPILLQENMWTYPGDISIAHRHMTVDIGTEGCAVPFLGIHKWVFCCSVDMDNKQRTRQSMRHASGFWETDNMIKCENKY
jgi:hypothetical protein